MATLAKITTANGVKYKAIIRKDGRILKTKTFIRKTDARIWAKRIEADHESMSALGSPGASITLFQLADEYMTQWQGKDPGQPARLAWWVDRMGSRNLLDITVHEIRNILDDYAIGKARRGNGVGRDGRSKTTETRRTRAPATINRMKASLSAIMCYAQKRGYLFNNPTCQVANRTENNMRVRWLSDEERKALLEVCKASEWPKLHLLVMMALTTGARQGELLKLRWSNINFKAKTAHLYDTKNGDDRILTLPSPALLELMKFREVGDVLVFPSIKKPRRPFEFRKHWNRALEQAGIVNFRFHDLRHSAASYLVMNGATLHETAEVLGHKSTETTKRYAHLSTQHKQALTEKILGGLMAED